MSTTLTVNVNTGADDIARDASGAEYVQINTASDELIFSDGSDIVKDGESIPNDIQLNQAGTIISADNPVIVDKCFLKDVSESKLDEVELFGNQNKRYVFNCQFSGETASEPVLEIWDNNDLDSIDLNCLGNGNANDSWFWGVVTTDGLPGAGWLGTSPTVGKSLAGSGEDHYLELNNGNGALSGAKDLYFQLKIIIPQNYTSSGAENPVMVIKYNSN